MISYIYIYIFIKLSYSMYFLYYKKILCMIHIYSIAFFESRGTYIRCMLTNDQPTMAMFVSEVDSGTKCCFCFIWHSCLPPLIYDMLFCSPTPAPPILVLVSLFINYGENTTYITKSCLCIL